MTPPPGARHEYTRALNPTAAAASAVGQIPHASEKKLMMGDACQNSFERDTCARPTTGRLPGIVPGVARAAAATPAAAGGGDASGG